MHIGYKALSEVRTQTYAATHSHTHKQTNKQRDSEVNGRHLAEALFKQIIHCFILFLCVKTTQQYEKGKTLQNKRVMTCLYEIISYSIHIFCVSAIKIL